MHKILPILIFGTMWGLIEAMIGGALHFIGVPYSGMFLASLGFAILFRALQSGVRPAHLVVVSLVAASFKFLDPMIFGIPFFNMHVINPAVAISSQGLAFAFIFRKSGSEKFCALLPKFFAATAISIIIFNIIAVPVLGWPTYQSLAPFKGALIQLPFISITATGLSWFYLFIFSTSSKNKKLLVERT